MEIIYDCRFSDNLDEKFIEDFIATEKAVFGSYTRELFQKKFIDNIYGPSVLEVVYRDGEPIGARALWRNDIGGKKAYQPGDTCVVSSARGGGVFTEMTKKSLELLDSTDIIYNYPNANSLPGYLKMGWRKGAVYSLWFFTTNKNYKKEHPFGLDETYADWWLPGVEDISYVKKGKCYYIVKPFRKGFYKIIAEVSEKTAKKFPKMPAGLLFMRTKKINPFNKSLHRLTIVTRSEDDIYLPPFKMDAI